MRLTPLKGIFIFLVCFALVLPVNAAISTPELELNPAGLAYEINPDSGGNLWVTDYWAGEIWRIPASGSTITVYDVGGGPSDARLDASGMLWWGDQNTNQVNRMNPADGSRLIWEMPLTSRFYGSSLGTDGIWLTDIVLPYLYHLNTSTNVICTYTLPSAGMSDYLLVSGGFVWLGDNINNRILRLQISNKSLVGWNLDDGAQPAGLALDSGGLLWWADKGLGNIAYLNPAVPRVYMYSHSTVQQPQSVAIKDGLVWFSDTPLLGEDRSVMGSLNPTTAATAREFRSNSSNLGTLTPTCGTAVPPLESGTDVPITTQQASWSTSSYPELANASGWKVYEMPAASEAWGITVTDAAYVVDQGRNVLARVPFNPTAALSISANKIASQASVPETGGDVTFTFTVTNTSLAGFATITSLVDSVFGPLAGDTDCQVGTVLPSMGSCEFSITRWLEGIASGPSHHNVFTVEVDDDAGRTASITAEATVDFTETQNQKIYIPLLLK